MTDRAAVLRANGIVADPADVIAAAEAAGLPLEVMAPKLLRESYGGRNVFGNDRVAYPPSGPYTADTVEVTYEACQAYLRWRRAGTGRANGVGPGQLTYHVLQDAAERRGGLHVPRVNMLVGAEEMARCLKAAGGDVAEAGARYNGGDRWRNAAAAKRRQAEEYGQWLAREAARWRALLASPAPTAPAPAPTKTPEVPVASLLWLPDVLRKAGCSVWEDPGWRSRSHGAMADIRGVLGHHTAGGGSNDWRVVRDGRAGLAGPLAQLTCERDGTFRVLASGQAWHAGTGGPWQNVPRNAGNQHLIGIEGVSTGRASGDWTKAQLEAYPRGVAAVLRHVRMGPDRFLFHTTWAGPRKSDIAGWPGGLDGFRRDIARHLNGSPAISSPSPAAPARPKGLPEMLERPISPSSAPTTGRIICPVGSASATVGKAWFSASFDGGARVEAWFQRAAPGSDGAAPGAGKAIDWTLRNAERPWVEVPSGTEFIQYRVTNVEGAGALTVELAAK